MVLKIKKLCMFDKNCSCILYSFLSTNWLKFNVKNNNFERCKKYNKQQQI